MGMKESLVVNWVDKTIEYQGKKLYIVEQFDYEGKEYLYAINVETINEKAPEITFLHHEKDDIFSYVEDNDLFDQLVIYGGNLMIANMIKEDINKLKQEGKI